MKEGWKYKKLGEVGKIVTGSTPSTKDSENYSSNDFCFVKPSDLPSDSIGRLSSSEFYISQKGYSQSRHLPKGTVLVSCIGSIGKVSILEVEAASNQQINAIIPNHTVNSDFLAYAIFSIRDEMINKANAPVVPIINKTDFSNVKVPLPPLTEQERIVSELDLLSSIIKKKKAQLKEYDQLAQSIFYDMFGDPVTNEKGWEVKKLGEVGLIVTGSTPSTRDNRNYDSNDICFIKPSDIEKEGISMLSESEFYVSAFAYNNARKLPKGSVLVTCIGIVGKVGILETDATCNQQINAIIPNNQVDSYYVAFSILAKRRIIESIAHAPVVPIINKGTFSKISIPLPPLPLQQSFAEKIESIEKQKELIKQSITETETLFNYTMDKYFNFTE